MAVRVLLHLESQVSSQEMQLDTVAVLNGGFESAEPCLLLPARAAARILTAGPSQAHQISAEVAGGETSFLLVDERVDGSVRTVDRQGPAVSFQVLISDRDREVLVSDSGIDALGIEVVRFGQGLWRFAGEGQSRASAAPRYW